MFKQSFLVFAIKILQRFFLLDLPLELDFHDFNNKMKILLSKKSEKLDNWEKISVKLSSLIENIKKTIQYKKIQIQIRIIQFFLISIIIISAILLIINPFVIAVIPLLVLLFFFTLFFKRVIIRRKLVKPNIPTIKKYLGQERKKLYDLLLYLKKHSDIK